MALLSALPGKIYRRMRGRKLTNKRLGRTRSCEQLALEVLEDRVCLNGNLLAAGFYTGEVLDYDWTQGTVLPPFAPNSALANPVGLAIGPNGDVFVGGRGSNDVVRYDGNTGAFLGTFVTPASGGLDWPHDLVFGPDGNLYVASALTSSILRYNGQTGAFLNVFVASGSGGLNFPHGITFGPDGNLYVGDTVTNTVLRYNGTTGAFMGAFVPAGVSPLKATTGLVFGPDGDLYVSSFNTNSVLRFDGNTGAYLGVFASGGGLSGPQGLIFGPDGNLYISSFNTDEIIRYNGQTGAFLNVFEFGGGLGGPTYLEFRKSDTTTAVSASTEQSVFGQSVTFTASVAVAAPATGALTGSVTFSMDGVAQAPVQISNDLAVFTTTALGVGNHTITASYCGDTLDYSSSGSLGETVNPASTTTSLLTSAPSVFGQPVTFTAAVGVVAPGAGTPSGTVTFTVDGTQESPVPLSGGQATLSTAALSVGSHTITAAYNGDGNFTGSTAATLSQTVNPADTTTAVTASADPSVFGQAVTFTAVVAAAAPGAGMPTGTITFSVDGTAQASVALNNGQASFTISTLTVGGHAVTATYSGDGNFNSSTSGTLQDVVNQANSTTTISSSVEPSVFGEPVTLVATVAVVAPGAGTPTGAVTFTIDGTQESPVPLSGGQAAFTISALSTGNHLITATYSGDGNFISSSTSALSQIVNPADTTTAVSTLAEPALFGQPLTIVATVSAVAPGAGTPTGTVIFTIDGTAQPAVSLNNGQADLTVSGLGVGSHSITAAYSGDSNFNNSTSAILTQVVSQAGTTTSLSASANPAVFGQQVSWVATVSSAVAGAGTPTGTITFTVDGVQEATVALTNGQATLTSTALSVGSHSVTASYSGDGDFLSSTAGLSQVVNQANTTIAFSASANPSVYGQPVTFTAAVSPVAPGVGMPTGTVTFSIDGTAQAPVALSNGQATFTTATLSVGSHTITAAYGGDGNFNPSTSAPLSLTVTPATTTIVFSASVTLSVFGQTVTFTAVVTVSAPGAGTPTGTVTFSIDGTTQSPITVNFGQATFSTATLDAGRHEIAMLFNGDSNFTSSSLDPAFTVIQANTVTTITASSTSSAYGQPVTFTAAVGAVAPGAGTPTGTVTFSIDGTAQTPIPVSNGLATFTTSTLAAGNHSVTAVYSGDSNFNGSSSAALSHTVNQTKAATTTVIHSSAAWSVFGRPVTFTAIVSPLTPGGGVPTGTVTFTVDGKIQTTVNLVNGTASFTTSNLAAGTHVIVAIYNGDSNFTASDSSPLTFTIKGHDHEHDHRHHKKDRDDRHQDEKGSDRDDGPRRWDSDAGGAWKLLGRISSHSDPLLQRILALKARILSRRGPA
jgi:flagellar hook assembly protein FlgD